MDFSRHVLTGSYHNYFRIFDVDTLQDIVLQADKSAFKAKKVGGPLPGKPPTKNGPRVGLGQVQVDALDFNKKILHASWHPREYTIAVCQSFTSAMIPILNDSPSRLLPRTICSYTAQHK